MQPDRSSREAARRALLLVQVALAAHFGLLIISPILPRVAPVMATTPQVGGTVVGLLHAAVPALAAIGVIRLGRALDDPRPTTRGLAAVLIYWAVSGAGGALLGLVDGPSYSALSLAMTMLASPFLAIPAYILGILLGLAVVRRLQTRFGKAIVGTRPWRPLLIGAILIAAIRTSNLLAAAAFRAARGFEDLPSWLPHVLGITGLAYLVIFLFWDVWLFFELGAIGRRIRAVGACPVCGYPAGQSPVCTECGTDLTDPGRDRVV